MKFLLNSVVIEYALNSMKEYIFLGRAYLYLMQSYYRNRYPCICSDLKSEAEMRTQGLSRSYVVASCALSTRCIVYSDFSGKKQRQTVLSDFPRRKKIFKVWYSNNSKPYQHKVLFNRINKRLGRIGGFANGVNHPIGYCAEQNVANRLLLDRYAKIDDIHFSIAIRPRTGEVIDYCNNCKTLFGSL